MKFFVFFLFLFFNLHIYAIKIADYDYVKFEGRDYLMEPDILGKFLTLHNKTIPEPDSYLTNNARSFRASYEIKDNRLYLTGIYIFKNSKIDSLGCDQLLNVINEVFSDSSQVEMKGLNAEVILKPGFHYNKKNQLIINNYPWLHLEVRKGFVIKQVVVKKDYLEKLKIETYEKFKSTKKFEVIRINYSRLDDEDFNKFIKDEIFYFSVNYD